MAYSSIILLLCALAACLQKAHFVHSSDSDISSDNDNSLYNSHDIPNPSPLSDLRSPDKYTIYFYTNVILNDSVEAEPFVVDITRALSPTGADRLYSLVKDNYFTNATFFRVVPDFVVQFGIASQPSESSKWNTKIKDDPVLVTNAKWTLVYAKTSYPNSRSTQLFINFALNDFLDGQGFSPFGVVVSGQKTLLAIANPTPGNSGGISQNSIYSYGSDWVMKNYPKTNLITYARVWEPTISPSQSPSIGPTASTKPSILTTYSPSYSPSYVPTSISPTTISPTYLPSELPTTIASTLSPTVVMVPVVSAGANGRSNKTDNLVFVGALLIVIAAIAATVMFKKGVFNGLLNRRNMFNRGHSPLRQREVEVGGDESDHGFDEEEVEEVGPFVTHSHPQSTKSTVLELGRM